MARMPGALWKPVTKSRAARRKGRGIILHVAVSEAASLAGYFQGASSDSHFYVRKDGTIEQYVDTDQVAYANAAANATMISVETQGGVTNANVEPWTPQQLNALTRLCAWAAQIDGFPLQLMPNSLPTSRGVGYHRLGCRPWVVAGGELWSSATGKICPGAGKIAQIPTIIAAAKGGAPVEDDMPSAEEVADAVWARTPPKIGGPFPGHRLGIIEGNTVELAKKVDALSAAVSSSVAASRPGPAASVDAAAVAAALAADAGFVAAIGESVAQVLAARLES